MLRVGLTGGIGSGKSEVARRLAELGAVVVDADQLARAAVAPGTDGFSAVVAAFGADVVAADGSLDRAALAARVFGDEEARRTLEAIIHPRVRELAAEAERAAVEADGDAVVVHDVPLLVETGRAARYDVVVVVDTSPQNQVDRLLSHRGMTAAEARARIAAQASRERRLAVADEVIANDGTLEDLRAQVDRLWGRLAARAGR